MLKKDSFASSWYYEYWPNASVVTVIETGTETAVFCQTEPNRNRGFMPLYWRFGFEMEQLWCLER